MLIHSPLTEHHKSRCLVYWGRLRTPNNLLSNSKTKNEKLSLFFDEVFYDSLIRYHIIDEDNYLVSLNE